MADFYSDMAKMSRELLAPTNAGGLGQGEITLTRITRTVVPGENTWDDDSVTETAQTETLRGAVRGVSKEWIGVEAGGAIIVASDRQAICAVPAMQYAPGDVLSVDGSPVAILRVDKIPAAGVPAAVRFLIRG